MTWRTGCCTYSVVTTSVAAIEVGTAVAYMLVASVCAWEHCIISPALLELCQAHATPHIPGAFQDNIPSTPQRPALPTLRPLWMERMRVGEHPVGGGEHGRAGLGRVEGCRGGAEPAPAREGVGLRKRLSAADSGSGSGHSCFLVRSDDSLLLKPDRNLTASLWGVKARTAVSSIGLSVGKFLLYRNRFLIGTRRSFHVKVKKLATNL